MNPPRIALAWYFHLPIVSSDIETRDHVRGSLQPLLRLHREHELPALIAPSGSFLTHCQRCEPDILDELVREVEAGRIAIAATYMYETDPLSVPWTSLIAQVSRDVALKRQIFGTQPNWFLLPNFVWTPGLPRILQRCGIRGALLDSRQLAASSSSRSWRWETDATGAVHTSAVMTPTEPWEHRRLRALADQSCATELKLTFRDWQLTRRLTFGNDGAIHRLDAHAEIERILVSSHAEQTDADLLVLADDGDRIRGTSLVGYESLLQRIERPVDWSGLIDEQAITPPLRELPVYSPPGVDMLLRGSEDARYYWSLLAEMRSFAWAPNERTEQLALEDVFYPYWPGVGRRQWYVEEAMRWIERGYHESLNGGGVGTGVPGALSRPVRSERV